MAGRGGGVQVLVVASAAYISEHLGSLQLLPIKFRASVIGFVALTLKAEVAIGCRV